MVTNIDLLQKTCLVLILLGKPVGPTKYKFENMISNISDELIDSIHDQYGNSLHHINLSSNAISDIKNISLLSDSIERLNLSNNNISDINSLKKLITLKEIDLSNNNISDISSLSNLTSIVSINLNNNNIKYISALEPLRHLPNLLYLSVQGNPLCLQAGSRWYISVFNLLPKLNKLDRWTRNDLRDNVDEILSVTERNLSNSYFIENMMPESKDIELLRNQLSAMEAAFSIQEKALSSHSSSSTTSLSYYKLLQQWRKQTIKRIYDCLTIEKSNVSKNQELRNMNLQLKETQCQYEANYLTIKERLDVSNQMNESLKLNLDNLSNQLAYEIDERNKLEEQLNQGKHNSLVIKSVARSCLVFYDKIVFTQQMLFNQISQKLKLYEEKFLTLAHRIEFVTTIASIKEVSYRNSQAALEVDKRLFLESHIPTNEALAIIEHTNNRPSITNLNLTSELESLLLGIFRHLDPLDKGLVDTDLLIECLSINSSFQESSNLSLGNIVRNELGEVIYNRLMDGLLGNMSINNISKSSSLTWGEFLLLLLPKSNDVISSPLTTSGNNYLERKELRDQCLLNDIAWGLVPLQIPIQANVQSNKDLIYKSDDFQRLVHERKYLLQRLQDMNMSFERRVESIRGFFHTALAKNEIKENRAKQFINELQHQVNEWKVRFEEFDRQKQLNQEKYELRINDLTTELSNLKDLLDSKTKDDLNKFEHLLLEEKSKFIRLDMEHQLLQRELGKNDVKCKGLSRDVLRLQTNLCNVLSENENLKNSMNELTVKQAELIVSLQNVTTDRNELQKLIENKNVLDNQSVCCHGINDNSIDSEYLLNYIKSLENEIVQLKNEKSIEKINEASEEFVAETPNNSVNLSTEKKKKKIIQTDIRDEMRQILDLTGRSNNNNVSDAIINSKLLYSKLDKLLLFANDLYK